MKIEKQKSGFTKIFVVVSMITVLFACSKSSDTTSSNNNSSIDCSGATKSFTTDVSPIIQTSCTTGSNCHGSGSVNGPGELLTYSQIFNARTQIRSAVLSGLMPKTGTLTSVQKNAIICWIDNGASNN